MTLFRWIEGVDFDYMNFANLPEKEGNCLEMIGRDIRHVDVYRVFFLTTLFNKHLLVFLLNLSINKPYFNL